ncbi:MAG: Zn-dependent hydrolase [Candidatus Lokiarchaeota archaeon]|nr:Zn-dependent hydrolase [Candidatus Lokiarchaeota archaeon]
MNFKIQFHGVACFSIHVGDLILVFDPHDGKSLDLPEPTVRNADIVLCSHAHYDHDAGKHLVAAKNGKIIVEEEGNFKIKGIEIQGIKVKHGNWEDWGYTIVYSVRFFDDLIFIHLGDMGYVPTSFELNSILTLGRPDVIFIPIGGTYVLNAKDAITTVKMINPKITSIVFHYLYGPLLTRDDFKGMTTEEPFLDLAASETTILNDWVYTSEMKAKKYLIFKT